MLNGFKAFTNSISLYICHNLKHFSSSFVGFSVEIGFLRFLDFNIFNVKRLTLKHHELCSVSVYL